MPSVHSKFMDEEAEQRKKVAKMWAPAISFFSDKRRKGKSSQGDEDEDSTNVRTFSVPLDPDTPEDDDKKKQYYTVKLPVFEMGDTPEEWCEWRFNIDDLIKTLGYTKTAQIVRVQRSLLKGKSAELYQSFYNKRFSRKVEKEDQQRMALNKVLNDMALKIFADGAWAARSQKRYMRNNLFMGNMDPEKFADRLEKLNDYLKYFPIDKVEMEHPPNKKLDWDELVDIMDYSTPRRWHPLMLSQGKQPHLFRSFSEAVTYYQRLYKSNQLSRKLAEAGRFIGGGGGHSGGGSSGKRRRGGHNNGKDNNTSNQKERTPCSTCGKMHRGKCWHSEDSGSGSRPNKRAKFHSNKNKSGKPQSSHVMIETKDLKKLVANQAKRPHQDEEESVGSFDNILASLSIAGDKKDKNED
ncbi:hypothetical protein SEMRO_732_G194380.1 [Seminavis robusta]|uniref:Uncharacterized protein n=1 Tax=Seminavis robusta TaxID=568900 RepID=A0A9N8E6P2_9STRA|nr:hypothetical protein SEMRO_732_G194380.1 [Seminavis robusta]|eukprot:Sro732_g194380.1 n/a (409) ;mRNA; f:5490-6804